MDTNQIFSALQKAMEDVKVDKDNFEQAQKEVTELSGKYQASLNRAQDLRKQLNSSLNEQMGETEGRGRIS